MQVWRWADVAGPVTIQLQPSRTAYEVPSFSIDNEFSGLSLTDQARATFVQALGLTDAGQYILSGVNDFGVVRTHVQVGNLAAIPEPSTWGLITSAR